MKKNNLVEIVLLGVLGALALLTLIIPQLLRDRDEPRLLSLSVLLRDPENSNWPVTRQGMEQAADELGAELRFLTLTAPDDSREQEELLRREVEGGADALIAIPADPEALHLTLLGMSEPCPVVTLECAMEGEADVVSPDNEKVGRRLAEALLEDWDGGEVLLLDAAGACPEAAIRLEAAREVLTGHGMSVRTAETVPEETSLRWVMAFEPGSTRQAAECKETEERSFALYGVGASTAVITRLERGTIAAIAAWSDYAAGYLAVRQAVQAVRESPQAPEELPFSIVRGEDIYAPENQKLLFPVMSSSGR